MPATLYSMKNPHYLIFSLYYTKQVPTFLFKIYICSLWKNGDLQWKITVNWMARIQFPVGAGILFIILSRPHLGPLTLTPNGLFNNSSPSSGRVKNEWSLTHSSAKWFYDMAHKYRGYFNLSSSYCIWNHSQNLTIKL